MRTDRRGRQREEETGGDEVGRLSDANGHNSRLGRMNSRSAIWTRYDKLSGRIEEITPDVFHKEVFGS